MNKLLRKSCVVKESLTLLTAFVIVPIDGKANGEFRSQIRSWRFDDCCRRPRAAGRTTSKENKRRLHANM